MESAEINSMKTDKLEGMEYIMEVIKDKGYDLRLIAHLREDEEGHHIFTVHYDPRYGSAELAEASFGLK